MNTKQATCEERIDAQLERTLTVIRDLWAMEDFSEYHPEHKTNLYEYGLSFDYVEPDTFEDQPYGFWRYQLSWGGPSSEFRLWGGGRIEFRFHDWFDGAGRDLSGDDLALMRDVFEWFLECQEDSHGF